MERNSIKEGTNNVKTTRKVIGAGKTARRINDSGMDCNGSRTISSWDSLPDCMSVFRFFVLLFFWKKHSIHCCNIGVAVKQKCNRNLIKKL